MNESDVRPLILIGYRATGKTTVGRLLAARLGWTFIDVDDEIERQFGGSIAAVFAAEGESGFRNREAEAIRALCAQERSVIATGGGAILRPESRTLLRRSGRVVWLTASPETIWSRLQSDPVTTARRPNLTSLGGLAEVQALLEVRGPLYRETAHFVADADAPSPELVAAAILTGWNGPSTCQSPSAASGSSCSA
jgi:shikimate kinase